MKKYEVYKNIRKQAMIMGLPISLFALMMTAILGSLLFIIFSFNFAIIFSVLVINITFYVALTHITKHPAFLHFKKIFPQTISNKKQSQLYYEED